MLGVIERKYSADWNLSREIPMMNQDGLQQLYSHHQATFGLFIAVYRFIPASVLLSGLTDNIERSRDSLTGALARILIESAPLQFGMHYPPCRAASGWETDGSIIARNWPNPTEQDTVPKGSRSDLRLRRNTPCPIL